MGRLWYIWGHALVVQWIEHLTPNEAIQVRFPVRAQHCLLVLVYFICIDNVHTPIVHSYYMDTVINIRTEKRVRDEAKKVFSKMGLSTSAGINMFLHQVVTEQGLPFTPTSDPKKLRERFDAEVSVALKTKKYLSAKAALRGL